MTTNAEHDDASASSGAPFGSREDLESALDARTHPTAADAARIAALEGLDLRQAVYRASDALAVFDDVLLQLQDDSFRLDEALAAMDANALTDEHGWASMLRSLAELPEEGDELRAVGLVKYRRYLRNRLEALESRQNEINSPGSRAEPASPAPDTGPAEEHDKLVLDLELFADEASETPQSESTVMHGSPAAARGADLVLEPLSHEHGAMAAADGADGSTPKRLLRLHRGKPVALSVAGRDEVGIWMGRSRFRLVLDTQGPRLFAEPEDYGRLRNGRSLIGRSPDCEVVVEAHHETVSRVHLEVEVEHGNLVAVTDLSSGGTYVRPELVPRRTNAA